MIIEKLWFFEKECIYDVIFWVLIIIFIRIFLGFENFFYKNLYDFIVVIKKVIFEGGICNFFVVYIGKFLMYWMIII